MEDSNIHFVPAGKGLVRRCLCAAIVIVLAFGLVGCSDDAREPITMPSQTNAPVPMVTIETAYATLEFPEALSRSLRHMEVMEGSVTMEVFYVQYGDRERELYRIYFGDARMGTPLGYWNTSNEEIPITYAFSQYSEEDFIDEEEKKLHHSMMDSFSTLVSSLHADERFSETKTVTPVGSCEVKLRYWTVTLPENVLYEETTEGNNYRVDFYGEVSGERIDLYFIGLGDLEAESILGMFTADGVQKPVAVGTHNLDGYAVWPEEDRIVIYQMMESVNDVIQVIVSDKDFSELVPAT